MALFRVSGNQKLFKEHLAGRSIALASRSDKVKFGSTGIGSKKRGKGFRKI